MKNVHLIPTEKLVKSKNDLVKDKYGDIHIFTKNDGKEYGKTTTKVNIYITSDEEIKEGDWCLSKLNKAVRFGKNFTTWLYKKIILTTDQDLDGVQSIDDKFLEWFVKNPSCESIKVVHKFDEDWSEESGAFEISYYKIIIPKEEPKTNLEKLPFPELVKEFVEYYENVPLTEEPLQETLEEASLRIGLMEIELNHTKTLLASCEKALENRDNQAKRMYSEEDLKLILQLFVKDTRGNSPWVDADDEWFEQNKRR